MPDINKVILIGNVGCDPKIGQTKTGALFASFDVVTSESRRDRASGEPRERVEQHHIVVFNEQIAEVALWYLREGSKVYIEGLLRIRNWQDRDGRPCCTAEIVVSQYRGKLVML